MAQKRVEFDGKIHEFPDDFTDADIAAALSGGQAAPQAKSFGAKALDTIKALGSVAVDPLGLVNQKTKSALADASSGAAKNVGRTALDLASLYTPGMGHTSRIPDLQSENTAEKVGSTAADIAMAIAPAAAGRVGVNAVRSGATALERSAVPMSRDAAKFTMANRVGRPTQANAAALAEAATPKALPGGSGKLVPKPYIQEAATAMDKAANKTPRPFYEDAMVGSGAYWLGGPKLAATIAALKLLNRPAVKATAAHLGYGAAPVLGPAGAGAAAGPAFRQVLDWLLKEDK